MANFIQNIKNLTKPYVDDESSIEGNEEQPIEEAPAEEEVYEEPAPKTGFGKRGAPKGGDYTRDYTEPRKAPASRAVHPEVHTYAPASFNEVREISQNLVDRRAVILNLEETNPDDANRLLDFMSGVAFALDGQIRRIAKQVYAFAPAGVDFIGFSVDESEENDGFYI